MPTSVIIVLGNAAVSRALPSFSVIEIMPVSAMAKFAPVMPTSAWRYFFRITRRATIVSSSGSSDGASLSFFWNRSLDLAARQVHRGEHEVIRRLFAELDDEFAQVGLDDFVARLLHRVVEMDFLGRHRLGFHDDLGVLLAQDAEDDVARLFARCWPNAPSCRALRACAANWSRCLSR